jgi:protein tyrosine phosphatase (PTP) superfamily phosphohydrolase (DUF442 family)
MKKILCRLRARLLSGSGRRWMGVALFPPLVLAAWVVYLLGTDNFHTVIEGEAYRAGQMNSNALVRCIQRHGIRSVINLRGEQPERAWYREEHEAARALDVTYRSLALSSRRSVSADKMQALSAILAQVPKPVLIHCDGGADRVAIAAAVYAADVAKQPVRKAERQFSMWYGYLPFIWKDKARLRESFRAHVQHGS